MAVEAKSYERSLVASAERRAMSVLRPTHFLLFPPTGRVVFVTNFTYMIDFDTSSPVNTIVRDWARDAGSRVLLIQQCTEDPFQSENPCTWKLKKH